MSEKVTVIVPAYNAEKTIEKCVDSIFAQSYQNMEIIIVDDGSTDKTPEICQRYEIGSRVKYFWQENSGVSAARNKGLELASGQKIIFCDSDDWLPKHAVESLMYNSENVDLVVSGIEKADKDGLKKYIPKERYITTREDIVTSLINCSYFMPIIVAKLFDAQIIRGDNKNDVQFSTQSYGEDTIFMYEYLLRTKHIRFVDVVTYHINEVQGSLSTKIVKNIWEQMKNVYMASLPLIADFPDAKFYVLLRSIKITLYNDKKISKEKLINTCEEIFIFLEKGVEPVEGKKAYDKVILFLLKKKYFWCINLLLRFRQMVV